MMRSVGNVLVFCVVLALACTAVRRVLERMPGLQLEEDGAPAVKVTHAREHADAYELLFLGSSRVYRQINPTVFDAVLAEHGIAVRSYNLGLPGMRFYELLRRIDQILEERPPALRWLVLELDDPDPGLEDANVLSRRFIEWHTARVSWTAYRTILASSRSPLEKLRQCWGHTQGLLLRASNAGLGMTAVESRFGVPPDLTDYTPAGFLPLDFDPTRVTKEHRAEFLADFAKDKGILERRAQAITDPDIVPRLPRRLRDQMRDLVARIRAAGIEPLFLLLPPAERCNWDWRAAHKRGALPALFSYDDPREYQDFYRDLALRFDINHLNKAGANALTRLLAEDVAAHIQGSKSQ
jgi:hypothetical protein